MTSSVQIDRWQHDGDVTVTYYARIPDRAADRGNPSHPGPTITYTLTWRRGTRPSGSGADDAPYEGGRGQVDFYGGATVPHTYQLDGRLLRDGMETAGEVRAELILRVSRAALADGAPHWLVLREARSAIPGAHPDSPQALIHARNAARDRLVAMIVADRLVEAGR